MRFKNSVFSFELLRKLMLKSPHMTIFLNDFFCNLIRTFSMLNIKIVKSVLGARYIHIIIMLRFSKTMELISKILSTQRFSYSSKYLDCIPCLTYMQVPPCGLLLV